MLGGVAGTRLKSSFFPKDLSHLSYVDVYLPEDAAISATTDAVAEADKIIRRVTDEYGKAHHRKENVLHSIASFLGGGAPRFWYSLSPQQRQFNYAQIVIELENDETPPSSSTLCSRR